MIIAVLFHALQSYRARQNNDKVLFFDFVIYITNINNIRYYQTGYPVDTKIPQGYVWWVLIVRQNHYDLRKLQFFSYHMEVFII